MFSWHNVPQYAFIFRSRYKIEGVGVMHTKRCEDANPFSKCKCECEGKQHGVGYKQKNKLASLEDFY